MYIYSMSNMEPAPPSAVFAQPMRLGSYADPLNLESVERETWHGLQYQLSRWQDKTASMGYQSDAEAIAALKAFAAQHFKPDSPDVQYLVRQGLIADTSEPVLAYYGLTRLLGFDEADARDFVATVYAAPVAQQAAVAQEVHDLQLIAESVNAKGGAPALNDEDRKAIEEQTQTIKMLTGKTTVAVTYDDSNRIKVEQGNLSATYFQPFIDFVKQSQKEPASRETFKGLYTFLSRNYFDNKKPTIDELLAWGKRGNIGDAAFQLIFAKYAADNLTEQQVIDDLVAKGYFSGGVKGQPLNKQASDFVKQVFGPPPVVTSTDTPKPATPSGTTQGGGVNLGVLAAIAYYLFS